MRGHLKRAIGLLIVLAVLPSVALADSGGAKVRGIPGSSEVESEAEVSHDCPEVEFGGCAWFAEASAESASDGCPQSWDDSHGVWVSEVRTVSGIPVAGNFAFTPYGLSSPIVVCLYVHAEGGSELVGQSHPYSVGQGREVLPPAPTKTISLRVSVYHGCKAHIYGYVNGHEPKSGEWGPAEVLGPGRRRELPVAEGAWDWALNAPRGGFFRVYVQFKADSRHTYYGYTTVRLRRCS
jgi:hypothetical protein